MSDIEIPFEPEEAAEELSQAKDIVNGKGFIKCPICGHRFPINYKKHPYRRLIKCNSCKTQLYQPYIDSSWKPKEKPKKYSKLVDTKVIQSLVNFNFNTINDFRARLRKRRGVNASERRSRES